MVLTQRTTYSLRKGYDSFWPAPKILAAALWIVCGCLNPKHSVASGLCSEGQNLTVLNMPVRSFRTISELLSRLQKSNVVDVSKPGLNELGITLAYSSDLNRLFLNDYLDLLLVAPPELIAQALPLFRIFNDSEAFAKAFDHLKTRLQSSPNPEVRWNAAWILGSGGLEIPVPLFHRLIADVNAPGWLDLIVHLSRNNLRSLVTPFSLPEKKDEASVLQTLWLPEHRIVFLDTRDDKDCLFKKFFWEPGPGLQYRALEGDEVKLISKTLLEKAKSSSEAAIALTFLEASPAWPAHLPRSSPSLMEGVRSCLQTSPIGLSLNARQALKLLSSPKLVDSSH